MKRTVRLTTATIADLEAVESWLRDGRVRRWLGGIQIMRTSYMQDVRRDPNGPGYVARMHKLAVRELGRDGEPPVGCVVATVYGVGDTTNSWTVRGPYYATLLYAVDPHRHDGGIGTAMLQAAIDHPELIDVAEFRCGIAVRNLASRRIARRVGFVKQPEPRPERRRRRRMLTYVHHRPI
ncbi:MULTISPECIES: GNAT family N-acetyltransferase [Nocardia]|uniref:GNAT family N-acetyltransferase n=1 Tax=Nocardia TaxID=1817 RepID=UPI000684663E|nr:MULTISPECIES: GNAT family N-acetyltransferase [Nocardia]